MANVNGFDPVAFSIDGGRHPASLLRSLAYAALSGEEGVITPDDCKVTQLSVAGTQVQISTGAVAVLNRFDAIVDQLYIANARSVSKLDVAPTTGILRSDMVVLRIRDPQYESLSIPAGQAPTYQYVVPEIIQGVPSSAMTAAELNLGYPAVALARIDLPTNTTNITAAMIKELRKLARPRTLPDQQTVTHAAGYSQKLTAGTMTPWATSAGRNIFIPKWAKKAIIEVSMGGVKASAGGVFGVLRARLGASGSQYAALTKQIGYDINTPAANNYDRTVILIADTVALADQIRGTTQPFAIEGLKSGYDATIEVDENTSISTKVTFMESVA